MSILLSFRLVSAKNLLITQKKQKKGWGEYDREKAREVKGGKRLKWVNYLPENTVKLGIRLTHMAIL